MEGSGGHRRDLGNFVFCQSRPESSFFDRTTLSFKLCSFTLQFCCQNSVPNVSHGTYLHSLHANWDKVCDPIAVHLDVSLANWPLSVRTSVRLKCLLAWLICLLTRRIYSPPCTPCLSVTSTLPSLEERPKRVPRDSTTLERSSLEMDRFSRSEWARNTHRSFLESSRLAGDTALVSTENVLTFVSSLEGSQLVLGYSSRRERSGRAVSVYSTPSWNYYSRLKIGEKTTEITVT